MSSRSTHRSDMPEAVRIRLLESDMDDLEEAVDRVAAGIEAVRKVLVGILISLATASVLLALNLVVVGVAG